MFISHTVDYATYVVVFGGFFFASVHLLHCSNSHLSWEKALWQLRGWQLRAAGL